MFIKGLKGIQEKAEEPAEQQQTNPNRMNFLWIKSGETALIRFIDDEQMLQTKIHEYEEIAVTGKKYKDTYCYEHLTGAPCKWCAAGNIARNVYVFLVYVYSIAHKNQNPALNKDSNAISWEPIKQGNQVFYKETVNGLRILRTKFGKDGYIKESIIQFVNEYGTLCDRDYKYTRTGESMSTHYSFLPKDPSKMSEEVMKAKAEAPTIEDIVIGNRNKDTVTATNTVPTNNVSTKEQDGVSIQEVEDLF